MLLVVPMEVGIDDPRGSATWLNAFANSSRWANGMPYRSDGKPPGDYYTYGAEVLAAGDGVVVHVRDDIPDYGIGGSPSRETLEKDGDVITGNLVVIEHGEGEYSLSCHMQAGSVPVKVGDRVRAGESIGRVRNSGHSQIPHVRFNLMGGPRWLEAKGLPALFHQLRENTELPAARAACPGQPVSGWWVRYMQ